MHRVARSEVRSVDGHGPTARERDGAVVDPQDPVDEHERAQNRSLDRGGDERPRGAQVVADERAFGDEAEAVHGAARDRRRGDRCSAVGLRERGRPAEHAEEEKAPQAPKRSGGQEGTGHP